MKNYEYVPKEEWKPVKKEIGEILRDVRLVVKNHNDITFSYWFIGSSKRGMITREIDGNQGFDFDVDIRVNDDDNRYSAEELKAIMRNAISYIGQFHGYRPGEDSTRVITIKQTDIWSSKILYSCDFAIGKIFRNKDGKKSQRFVFFDKKTRQYCWEQRSSEYCNLKENEAKIKAAGKWNELREVYLEKKCLYSDEKKSRALYVEAVHEVLSRL